LVKSLKGSWPFWVHHKIGSPPKEKKNKQTSLQTWFFFHNCSLIDKSDDVPHKKLSQIWLLPAKNEKKKN
jgi:hypothetical protein